MIKIIYIAYFVWISIALLRNEINKPKSFNGPYRCCKEWIVPVNEMEDI